MSIIYHVTSAERWNKEKTSGRYTPAEFEVDGFIHLCQKDQLAHVWNNYYRGSKGMLILVVDEDLVRSPIRYENLTGGATLFPHIYGPLDIQAVQRVVDFPGGPGGEFRMPEGI